MARAIDADTLDFSNCRVEIIGDTRFLSLRDVANVIKTAPTLTSPNEWVSVEERLPEPDFPGQQRGFYLVALSNGTVKELMYEFRHYENMMFDVGWHETAYPITHWMPLPAPPDRRPPKREE